MKDFRDLTSQQRLEFLAGWQNATLGTERPAKASAFFEQGVQEAREHTKKVEEAKKAEEPPPEPPQ